MDGRGGVFGGFAPWSRVPGGMESAQMNVEDTDQGWESVCDSDCPSHPADLHGQCDGHQA
jgi:hypothetical protein